MVVMEEIQSFRGRLKLEEYSGLQDPQDSGRCQTDIFDFMAVLQNHPEIMEIEDGKGLVDDFCRLVNHQEVWHLAQMVVGEFRLSRQENEESQRESEADFTSLNYVLDRLQRLPPPPIDNHTLINEHTMVLQRMQSYFTFLGSGASGKDPTGKTKELISGLVDLLDDMQRPPSERPQKQDGAISDGEKKQKETSKNDGEAPLSPADREKVDKVDNTKHVSCQKGLVGSTDKKSTHDELDELNIVHHYATRSSIVDRTKQKQEDLPKTNGYEVGSEPRQDTGEDADEGSFHNERLDHTDNDEDYVDDGGDDEESAEDSGDDDETTEDSGDEHESMEHGSI